jgi:hypothetical protein
MPSTSDLALPSQTVFYAMAGDWALGPSARLSGEVGLGETRAEGRFLSTDGRLLSGSWRLALTADCPGWALGCGQVTVGLSQPLRLERGVFTALLADAPAEYFDAPTFSLRRFNATPTGRQLDFTVAAERRFRDGSVFSLQGVASHQPRHVATAEAEMALIGTWRRGF